MKYIEYATNIYYTGNRANWRDIPTTSEPPSPHHRPVIEGGEHVGWEIDAEGVESLKADQIQAINDAYSEAVAPLIEEYPEVETKGWPQQDAESLAYIAWHEEGAQGDPPATPVLDRILAGRNGIDGTETLLELCHAVRVNAAAFAQAQELTGLRQRLVRQIRDATTADEVLAVTWPVPAEELTDA